MKSLTVPQQESLVGLMYTSSKYIIGVDEVGLGAWAGPLVVAAVLVEKGWSHPDVKDSKKYTNKKGESAHKKREQVSRLIWDQAKCVNVATFSSEVIDRRGVQACLLSAFNQAIRGCAAMVIGEDVVAVADGTEVHAEVENVSLISIPKADRLVPAVSAASVVAKAHRDNMMRLLHNAYPKYGFDKHVGYGTRDHQEAIERLGLCPIHRRSYKPIKRFIEHGVCLSDGHC